MYAFHSDGAKQVGGKTPGAPDWRVVALCWVVAAFDGFGTQSIASTTPMTTGAWGTSVAPLGRPSLPGLLGLTVSALGMGILCDRIGRKRVIVVSLLATGIFSLWTAEIRSWNDLAVARLFAGVALGGILPSILAFRAEYSSSARRSSLLTSMFSGFPLGAIVGSFAWASLIAQLSWISVFFGGGVFALVLALCVLMWWPDINRRDESSTRRTRQIAGIRGLEPSDAPPTQGSLAQLFSPSRRATTLTLWAIFFCQFFVTYLLVGWLPIAFAGAGLAPSEAILGTGVLNLGGIAGGFVIARTLHRRRSARDLRVAYLGAAIFVCAIGIGVLDMHLLMALTFSAGFCLIGAQFGITTLAAAYYPTEIRSTGIGWALGAGRVGAIVGPEIGRRVVALGTDAQDILATAAGPALACLLGIVLMSRFSTQRAVSIPGDSTKG